MAIKILNDLLPVAEQTEVGVVKPDNVSITVTQDGELQSVVVDLPEEVVTSDNYVNAKLWKGTLEEYNAIETKDPLVTYIVTDDNVETLKTTDYNRLDNKPSIENITLEGNKTLEDLNIQAADTSLTTSQITNCITKIPQDIKLELTDSVLTLKAGSKVYVPNGFEEDGVTRKFDIITIDKDRSRNAYISKSSRLCVANNTSFEFYPQYASGATINRPLPDSNITICYYDIDLNKMFVSFTGAEYVETYLSLPFAIASMENNSWLSIDQIFNGFGYIGSTIFALPGIEGLIPNGKNVDGSLNNTKFTTANVLTKTETSAFSCNIGLNASTIQNFATAYYDDKSNLVLNISGYNLASALCGTCVRGDSGRVLSFSPKNTFQAVDRNDTEWASLQGKPSNRYIDLTLGASGSTYTAPANGWFSLWQKDSTTSAGKITIRNTETRFGVGTENSATGYTNLILPVHKNEQIIIYYNDITATDFQFRFYYDEGVQ